MASKIVEESDDEAKRLEETLESDVVVEEDICEMEEEGAVGFEKNVEEDEEQSSSIQGINNDSDDDACNADDTDYLNAGKKPKYDIEDYILFYSKQCISCDCPKTQEKFIIARPFVLSYFKLSQKGKKTRFICVDCYAEVMKYYEESIDTLISKEPLRFDQVPKSSGYVEVDSSDEDDIPIPEERFFTEEDMEFIDKEFMNILNGIYKKVDITSQLTRQINELTKGVEDHEKELKEFDEDLGVSEKILDKIQGSLQTFAVVETKELPTLHIIDGNLPPAGDIQRPDILLNKNYYAVKTKAIASWVLCQVVGFVEGLAGINGVRNYKIKYDGSQSKVLKTVSAKHLAYFDAPEIRLPVGTRVIGLFNASTLTRGSKKVLTQNAFYPGIIAEPLKQCNQFRYLIFYDDGYVQYVEPENVRLVCQSSVKVWEDVHPASRDFIQKYVEQYSINRPLVQTQKGQSMHTESNGTWLHARVIDMDCSLVLMQFDGPTNHTEWLYRGSMRLGPVFREHQKQLESKEVTATARVPRRTEPFIRYTEELERSNTQVNQQRGKIAKKIAARKNLNADTPSTSSQPPQDTSQNATSVRHLNTSTIYVDDEYEMNQIKGQTIYYTAKRSLPPKPWKKHKCNPRCLFIIKYQLNKYSPLAKPLLSGWDRIKLFKKNVRTETSYIIYKAPCGRSLRNMEEVRRYLRITDNELNVDNFDFNSEIRCLVEFKIDNPVIELPDISNGLEEMPVPVVNYYDSTLPPPIIYAAQRIPTEGVSLNLDEKFLCGCDCEDDCSDKTKCSCWQLTVQGVRFCNPKKALEKIGYQHKRLNEHVATGIYECNSQCKCKANCLNRVVQHSLQIKLQVYKTSNRGWGLLSTNDIPKGTFICIYAGNLLTETKANEGDAADEYFAELDYIEVAEQLKEGYECDVQMEPEDDNDSIYIPDPEDDEFQPTKYFLNRSKKEAAAAASSASASSARNSSQSQMIVEQDSQERQVISFNPNAEMNNETLSEKSMRQMFGKDEAPYVMDAKDTGNLGRYFNHSCNPNLFVQNVFVDTHDLRFPWVAFFASRNIAAGTELTWNYNYEVGAVPGKALYCQCGASNCRIRLL